MNDISSNALQRSQAQVAPRQGGQAARPLTLTPAVDVEENSHGITLWLDMPAVPKEKLEIEVHDDNLRIQGEAVVPTPENLQLKYAEVRESRFARSFTLAPDLDTSRIDANLQDGVLRVTIPRREEARPRRIEVQAG
ncbi:heat-shock protein [Pollutimonas subterranea]|uniref:Heat-shock protein n=1 Tax=Pollutimonas subterranea TaxID=2045210 RepID=A0A2N4TZR2_9BURK|nr:Hsp20/alpha crystallin family protein [Pollutimonas subterranea]PLC48255.1 heat-shock protein [Pollutimonas subterranea]